ncbi:MAG: flagellar biosynthesis protein FlhB [Spirochaetales bacterium]|nr:MAG: flagellar biosynthesis protein FlhB [Spirochaetales bacterium]
MSERRDPKERRNAVALRYDESLPAPIIIANLSGRAVERALDLAKEAGVPIVRDPAVTTALLPLEVGQLVPPEYWRIVADVFVIIRKVRA